MKVKPIFVLAHSYTSVLITFMLFVLSSCVSDEITTDMALDSEPDIEQTDNFTSPENPAPAFSLQTSTGEVINLSDFEGKVTTLFFFGNGCPPGGSLLLSTRFQWR